MKDTQNRETHKKEDVNRKTSIIFMQLGLVLALLLAYIAIESKTLVDDQICEYPVGENDFEDMDIPETTQEVIPPKKTIIIPEPDLGKIDIVKDNAPEETNTLFDTSGGEDKAVEVFNYNDIPYEPIKEEVVEDVSIGLVHEMPVFPGCTGNKEELKMCLSKEIGKVVKRYFNPDIAQDIGLKPGVNRIFVMFVIDKDGNISKIKSNAPHKSLENEAIRVLGKIPQIKPGKFMGENVGVKYSLPITYQVVE